MPLKMSEENKDSVKVVIFSDTHTWHKQLKVPRGDVLVCCGDYSGIGSAQECHNFGLWMGKQPHAFKVVVAGNHDRDAETSPDLTRRFFANRGILYLENSGCSFRGLNIYGTPIQPFFNNWAFNVRSANERYAAYAKIPDNTDILITHCPPAGILDKVGGAGGERAGCYALFDAVMCKRPKLHCFGHIHHSAGIEQRNGTWFVNAAICDEQYKPTNPFVVVEIDLETKRILNIEKEGPLG